MGSLLKYAAAAVILIIAGAYIENWPTFEKYVVAALVGFGFGFYQLLEENKRLWGALRILQDRLDAMQGPIHDMDED